MTKKQLRSRLEEEELRLEKIYAQPCDSITDAMIARAEVSEQKRIIKNLRARLRAAAKAATKTAGM